VQQRLPPPVLPPETPSHTSRTPCLLLTDSYPQQKRRRRKPKKSRSAVKQIKKRRERSKSEKIRKKLKSIVLCVFSFFAGDDVPHSFRALRRRAATVPAFPEVFLCNS
jgi:hypothetical protein